MNKTLPLVAMALIACEQATVQEPLDRRFDIAAAECATNPDYVVTNVGQYVTAYTTAAPGAVIAIDGMIAVPNLPAIGTPNLTFTCATRGSGLKANTGAPQPPQFLMNIVAPHISVRGLIMDARGILGPVQTTRSPTLGTIGTHLTFESNLVYCGDNTCLFLPGGYASVVRFNEFIADGAGSGVHVQGIGGPPNGASEFQTSFTRIEANTITAVSASTNAAFGAIRVRDGSNIYVARNVVRGPWLNAISITEVHDSRFEHNDIGGALRHGIVGPVGRQVFPSISGTTFLANRFRTLGVSLGRMNNACANAFIGNAYDHKATPVGIEFTSNTGANVFVGGGGQDAVDNGSIDCDGDGIIDANRLSGVGKVKKGVSLGAILGASRDAGELQ